MRPNLLYRAIQCFISQTYTNKELIIVLDDDDFKTIELLNQFNHDISIKTIINEVHKNLTLGSLRNLGIKNSNGDFICQWDDDDWYHIHRLEIQLSYLLIKNVDACVLDSWIFYDNSIKRSFFSNKRYWEGSILCNKKIFEFINYPNLTRGEDTLVISFLRKNNNICLINNFPHLYIYTYHGLNTWNHEHFKRMFFNNKLVPDYINIEISKALDGELNPIEFSLYLNEQFLNISK